MMNERIQELVEQARRYAEDKQNDPLRIYTLDMFTQKFAESVAKDVAEYLTDFTDAEIEGFVERFFSDEEEVFDD